jgi:hypothetical protein
VFFWGAFFKSEVSREGAMGFKKILIGAASVMALTTGLATAGYERDGWYVGLEGGWGRVSETDISNEPLEFADGMAVLGTAGYAFKNSNWRIEGEVGYREQGDVDTLDKATFDDGRTRRVVRHAERLYDFNLNSETWGLASAPVSVSTTRAMRRDRRPRQQRQGLRLPGHRWPDLSRQPALGHHAELPLLQRGAG